MWGRDAGNGCGTACRHRPGAARSLGDAGDRSDTRHSVGHARDGRDTGSSVSDTGNRSGTSRAVGDAGDRCHAGHAGDRCHAGHAGDRGHAGGSVARGGLAGDRWVDRCRWHDRLLWCHPGRLCGRAGGCGRVPVLRCRAQIERRIRGTALARSTPWERLGGGRTGGTIGRTGRRDLPRRRATLPVRIRATLLVRMRTALLIRMRATLLVRVGATLLVEMRTALLIRIRASVLVLAGAILRGTVLAGPPVLVGSGLSVLVRSRTARVAGVLVGPSGRITARSSRRHRPVEAAGRNRPTLIPAIRPTRNGPPGTRPTVRTRMHRAPVRTRPPTTRRAIRPRSTGTTRTARSTGTTPVRVADRSLWQWRPPRRIRCGPTGMRRPPTRGTRVSSRRRITRLPVNGPLVMHMSRPVPGRFIPRSPRLILIARPSRSRRGRRRSGHRSAPGRTDRRRTGRRGTTPGGLVNRRVHSFTAPGIPGIALTGKRLPLPGDLVDPGGFVVPAVARPGAPSVHRAPRPTDWQRSVTANSTCQEKWATSGGRAT
ncbi:hypothetical protein J3R03_006938 [Actinoplanes couchii]|nr:hypothetical protein [Actinoplanes couchii]